MNLSRYKWYRKLKGGIWYKHENTFQLPGLIFDYFWTRYGEINRFSKVTEIENYN